MVPTASPVLLWLAFSSQAGACLFCFSTQDKRLRVCQYFLGYANEQHKACLAALSAAFQPYVKIQVGVFELEKLKDIFVRVIFYMEEKGMAKVPYQHAFREAAENIRKELEALQKAPACIPPCGFQKEARTYKCESCRVIDCPLPIDCPVKDIHKAEGDITMLKCSVKFSIPSERIIKWKFIKDVRSQDLSFFEDLYIGSDSSFLIRPTTGARAGTYACEIVEGDDVLVRKFTYLNAELISVTWRSSGRSPATHLIYQVTMRRLGKEKELQAIFQAILNPPPGVAAAEEVVEPSFPTLEDLLREPDSLHKKSVILLFVGVVLSSMLVTLLLMGVYYWATDVERS